MSGAAARIRAWREKPAQFVHEVFGVTPDAWQQEGLQALASNDPRDQRIALQACAGPGKTAALAWAGWWFLSTQGEPGEHPKGLATSVTSDNLKDNLWAELAKWRGRSEFLLSAFEWTHERIFAKDHPETWFISARTWPKTASAEEQGRTLSGLHSRYVLYLVDESGDIAPAVLRAAEQGLGNTAFGKIIQAGNPTSHDGMLYAASTTLAHQWRNIRITGDPDDPRRSPRIPIEWAREQIANYGRDNPWVMAYILGLFPPSSLNSLLGPDQVEAAQRKHYQEHAYSFAPRIIGVDVSRFGDDRTVIFPRQGLVAFRPVVMRNARTNEIAARVAMAWDTWDADAVFVDDTGGWGAGVIDCLLQANRTPIPVNFSGKATDPRYFNKRAEMHFRKAEWVKRGGALPPLPELKREMTAATYEFQGGKFRIEDKAQIKERLGFSPDYDDALGLTFAQEMPPRQRLPSTGEAIPHSERGRAQVVTDWDPFAEREAGARGRVAVPD